MHFKGDKGVFERIAELAKSMDRKCKIETTPLRDYGIEITEFDLSEEAAWEFFGKTEECPKRKKCHTVDAAERGCSERMVSDD